MTQLTVAFHNFANAPEKPIHSHTVFPLLTGLSERQNIPNPRWCSPTMLFRKIFGQYNHVPIYSRHWQNLQHSILTCYHITCWAANIPASSMGCPRLIYWQETIYLHLDAVMFSTQIRIIPILREEVHWCQYLISCSINVIRMKYECGTDGMILTV